MLVICLYLPFSHCLCLSAASPLSTPHPYGYLWHRGRDSRPPPPHTPPHTHTYTQTLPTPTPKSLLTGLSPSKSITFPHFPSHCLRGVNPHTAHTHRDTNSSPHIPLSISPPDRGREQGGAGSSRSRVELTGTSSNVMSVTLLLGQLCQELLSRKPNALV